MQPLEHTEPATSVIDAARSLAAALAGITQLTALDENGTSPRLPPGAAPKQSRRVHAHRAGVLPRRRAHRLRSRGVGAQVPSGPRRRRRAGNRRPTQAPLHSGPRVAPRVEKPATHRPSRSGPDERLRLPTQRPRAGARPAVRAALHLLRLGAGFLGRLRRQRSRPVAHRPASHGGGPAPRFRGAAVERRHARPARPGDQLRPGVVPVRSAGQRQEQHRRADHRRLRPRDLGAPRHRRRRRDSPRLRSREPRRIAAGAGRRPARSAARSTSAGSASAGPRSSPAAN